MTLRAVVFACLGLSVAVPALPQVAPWPGSAIGAAPSTAGTRGQGGGPRGPDGSIGPSPPRWGGGAPPPGPFDRPVPPMPSQQLQRPGVDAFRARPDTYAPRFSTGEADGRGQQWRDRRRDGDRRRDNDGPRNGGGRHRGNRGGAVVYSPLGGVYIGASPYYYWPSAVAQVAQPAVAAAPEEAEGFLRLLVTPRSASVFVDGVYEGTVDDFGGASERALRAGIHSVHVQAEGFEPVEFDVRVPARDTITLRRDLEPRRLPPPPLPAAALPAAPARPKTIYVIPRCYLGDSRPLQSQLPAGCSLADLKTLN